jgi:homoserine O-succinyltransferase
MPIILPEDVASAALLRSEGIEVLHRRPRHASTLRVGLLNLMPDKTATEMQFARLLGATRRHVELVFALPRSYRSGSGTPSSYERWSDYCLPRGLDGLIITGAPLEHLPFEDVAYWRELSYICHWAAGNIDHTFYVCWAAFAALYAFHGVRTRMMPHKLSGVFNQQVVDARDPLMTGLGASFPCPVSRHAEVVASDMPWRRGLTCLAQSLESGICLVADSANNAHYMFNHLEYDADTLKREYLRDRARSAGTTVPHNYLPNDDVSQAPFRVWRQPAENLFANWLTMLGKRACQAEHSGRSAA